LRVDEVGGDGGRAEQPQLGVGGGEVELAVLVLDPVAGEVHQQQVIGGAVDEELLDRLGDHVRRLVEHGAHLEAADVRVAQHPRQCVGAVWRRSLGRPGDARCQPAAFGRAGRTPPLADHSRRRKLRCSAGR